MKKRILGVLLMMISSCLFACNGDPAGSGPETSALPNTTSVMQTTTTKAATAPVTSDPQASAPVVHYETVQNPIYPTGNDPWVIEHGGKYYYCFSRNNGVAVGEIPSIHQVTNQTAKQVYSAPSGTLYSKEYWAPELHYINGEWYIYVAADDGNNDKHRMYVLKGTSQDPTDPFEMMGKITDPTDKWAIDGTVLQWKGELYFVWSGWEGDENVAQNIYIAHMSDPCTIDSERVLLSTPDKIWERVGTPYVNEGPTALLHDDKVFLVYSASGSWTDSYCLGMLTLTGDDPLDAASWQKEKLPVFRMKPGVAYGPGHCSFSAAVDGSIWMIYHANPVSGTGWSGRTVWIQPIPFDEDGKPVFGNPTPQVEFPVSIS